MTGMNFGGAPTQQMGGDRTLIPKGTLAWAVLTVRPFNFDAGMCVTMSKKNNGNGYLDCELTIAEGPHAGKKVWDMIGVAGTEKYVSGGHAAIRHILEVGKQAHPTNNPGGYVIGRDLPETSDMGFMDLDGMKVAIKIGIEPGSAKADGSHHPDKNRVDRYLSPNPESDTHKDYARIMAGDTEPTEREKAAAAAAPAARPAAAPTPMSKPAFLGGAPAKPAGQPVAATPPAATIAATSAAAPAASSNKAPW